MTISWLYWYFYFFCYKFKNIWNIRRKQEWVCSNRKIRWNRYLRWGILLCCWKRLLILNSLGMNLRSCLQTTARRTMQVASLLILFSCWRFCFFRGVGMVRATFYIGFTNLVYNMCRLVQIKRYHPDWIIN